MLDRLRRLLRLRAHRCPWPVRIIIDAQTVKGTETVPNATRGFGGAKLINGLKRHLAAGSEGLLVDVVVTSAGPHDSTGGRILLTRLHQTHPEITLAWGDAAYAGQITDWARDTL
ncbi:transposase [Streptomyces sp. NPDC014894]|uniref:transposase n=1 Tax=Streptomyces sp. NPDC014894 TaxID=3364931 RepID=UPI003700B845